MSEESKFKSADSIFEGRLRGNQLMASGLRLGPLEGRLLWESPRMLEISWLDLDDNRLGDQGLADLAECANLINVSYLNLNKNGITDEGIKALANSRFLPKLKRLHLKDNSVKGEGVILLFNSPTLDGLQSINIHEGWSCKKREGWRYNPQNSK